MKKAYAEKRYFEWHEDELAVSLRAKSGSYGGGSEVLVLQRRFSDVRIYDTEICTSLESGGGEGGNNLPMIVEEANAEGNRNIEPRSASGQLQRAGCVQ